VPVGVLALVTQAAMKSSGYDVKICFVCWSEYGPREIADRLKPIFPSIDADDPIRSYIEDPPDAVPDISATSQDNLIAAWNGTGLTPKIISNGETIASLPSCISRIS